MLLLEAARAHLTRLACTCCCRPRADALSARHNLGPRLVIWVGCVLMVVGYGGMWAQAVGVLAPSFTGLMVCGAIAGAARRGAGRDAQ